MQDNTVDKMVVGVVIFLLVFTIIVVVGGLGLLITSNLPNTTKAWCQSIGDTQYANGHCYKNGIELKMSEGLKEE